MLVRSQLGGAVGSSRQLLRYWYSVKVDYNEELVEGCIPGFKLTLKPVSLPLLQWSR